MSENSVSSVTLQYALNIYLLDCRVRNLAPDTVTYYQIKNNRFIDYLTAQKIAHIGDVRAAHVRAYLVSLEDAGWSASSRHTEGRAIRAFLRFCYAEELTPANPVKNVRLPRLDEDLPDPFSSGDIKKLLAACKTQRDRAAILCLLDTGCRASELLAWSVRDVNITTGAVGLTHTKNRKPRTVYLGNLAKKELLKLMAGQSMEAGSPIWINQSDGERLQYYGLAISIRKVGRRAGVLPCNLHRFRHTFAIESLRAGMSIYHLRLLMGHSSLDMLQRYLKILDADLIAASDGASPADRLTKK